MIMFLMQGNITILLVMAIFCAVLSMAEITEEEQEQLRKETRQEVQAEIRQMA